MSERDYLIAKALNPARLKDLEEASFQRAFKARQAAKKAGGGLTRADVQGITPAARGPYKAATRGGYAQSHPGSQAGFRHIPRSQATFRGYGEL